MSEIVNRYNPSFTIALGDAPNDVEMLEAADLGVIVANPDGKPIPRLDGETKGRIIRTKEPGPAGWADAVLRLLADYERTKDVSLHG
jgi:mannosyl-3-phosphoglycerate phosphatase